MKLYRGITITFEVVKIFVVLFFLWPFVTWLNFWTTFKPETLVMLNKIKIVIRTKNIFTKITDICMAYECILRDDYQLRSLKLSKGDVVIDIGAHIGSFSLAIAKQFPQVKILSFEPSLDSYKVFKKNIEVNNYKNIVAFNKAITSQGKKITLYLDSVNSALNSVHARKNNCVEISSISIERVFQDNNIKKCAFIKMDCEVAEYDIILNTSLDILRKIELMVIEYHNPVDFGIVNKKYTLSNLIKHLENSGFTCNVNKMKKYQGMVVAKR
jgi:FkbM family methyltransferase|tara:strand:- start:395 stop:1204 length:810 start_codon:yes stop_codon:yes gene_type:complete